MTPRSVCRCRISLRLSINFERFAKLPSQPGSAPANRERNERHPIVEDDVIIYAGATILGRVTIGRGSTIGGNVWLTKSVEAGSNIT